MAQAMARQRPDGCGPALGDLHAGGAAGLCRSGPGRPLRFRAAQRQDAGSRAAGRGPAPAPGRRLAPWCRCRTGSRPRTCCERALVRPHVMGGVAYIFAQHRRAWRDPACRPDRASGVRRTGRTARARVRGRFRRPAPRPESAADATDRIDDRIWRKFVLLAPLAGATCLGRCPVGGVRDDPGSCGPSWRPWWARPWLSAAPAASLCRRIWKRAR